MLTAIGAAQGRHAARLKVSHGGAHDKILPNGDFTEFYVA